MKALERYLTEMRDNRSTGATVEETSFYPALSNLLNEIGKTLKPKIRCVINIANRGAGLPDGGFFTAGQLKKNDPNPMEGQPPEAGVLEAKGLRADVEEIAQSEQVKRYLAGYGLVLVTNYREFVLLGQDVEGNPLPKEGYRLSGSEADFWKAAAHPEKTAREHGERFTEYLKRVMLSRAPLTNPKDVAWFLASYARDAKGRMEGVELPALAIVRTALEEALGMKFTGEHGEHFFRSTLVQTIFYGVFSAWVLWHRDHPASRTDFNWHEAQWSLRVPFIRALYDEIATPNKLGPLGLVEVLDWTAAALNRVDRVAFFDKFEDAHAVQYFYEPFLEAYDPELRKELGVWYTPTEIVQYQVARVDRVLREELGLEDGLADPNVVVLDPCCGTGAYLVEVLKRIAKTLKEKGGEALIASDLKKAAMTRVFGFEILPAPFVVAHLQLGLMLQDLGAPLKAKSDERVGVYLTNALTGWEPAKAPKTNVFPELQAERDAAEKVKRKAKVLVVLGNPPYNAFAGVSPEEEQGLVEPYKKDLNKAVAKGGWGIKKFNLDDLYIRFFRLAERRIAEMTGKGVVSFISNFSYLSDPSFVVMRERFLSEFDKLWFDCMNGDSRETGKLTPEGKPDPSVFSTEQNREGIRVGTAICVMVRKEKRDSRPTVLFREFWGVNKREELLASLGQEETGPREAKPGRENRNSLRPEGVSLAYCSWPRLPELCEAAPSNGLMEKRGGALIDIDKGALEARMKDYFNRELSWEGYKALQAALVKKQARFDPVAARKKALASEGFDAKRLVGYIVRPFDTRWCYYTGVRPVWNEPRPALWAHCFEGNAFLMVRPVGVSSPEGVPMFFTQLLGDNDALRGHAYLLPLGVKVSLKSKEKDASGQSTFGQAPLKANLSAGVRSYLTGLGIRKPDEDSSLGGLVWMHALAIGYSPAYLVENADGIRRDWPRIPLPASRKALEESAGLGRMIAALLDTENEVAGVTSGKLEEVFRSIGNLAKVGGGSLNPDAGDLALTVGWGHAGKGGVTMPGGGRIVERAYDKDELKAIEAAAKAGGLSVKSALELLGTDTRDVYLNDKAYWKNVPAKVWEYTIGGYQVMKKWLSYREEKLLGRALKADEAREVMNMGRRIAAIIMMQPVLNENYRRVAGETYAWPGVGEKGPASSR